MGAVSKVNLPEPGETKSQFITRSVRILMKNGKSKSDAVGISTRVWDNMSQATQVTPHETDRDTEFVGTAPVIPSSAPGGSVSVNPTMPGFGALTAKLNQAHQNSAVNSMGMPSGVTPTRTQSLPNDSNNAISGGNVQLIYVIKDLVSLQQEHNEQVKELLGLNKEILSELGAIRNIGFSIKNIRNTDSPPRLTDKWQTKLTQMPDASEYRTRQTDRLKFGNPHIDPFIDQVAQQLPILGKVATVGRIVANPIQAFRKFRNEKVKGITEKFHGIVDAMGPSISGAIKDPDQFKRDAGIQVLNADRLEFKVKTELIPQMLGSLLKTGNEQLDVLRNIYLVNKENLKYSSQGQSDIQYTRTVNDLETEYDKDSGRYYTEKNKQQLDDKKAALVQQELSKIIRDRASNPIQRMADGVLGTLDQINANFNGVNEYDPEIQKRILMYQMASKDSDLAAFNIENVYEKMFNIRNRNESLGAKKTKIPFLTGTDKAGYRASQSRVTGLSDNTQSLGIFDDNQLKKIVEQAPDIIVKDKHTGQITKRKATLDDLYVRNPATGEFEYEDARDEDGNILYQPKVDSDGNTITDDDGNIQYETEKDKDGNIIYDSKGNVKYKTLKSSQRKFKKIKYQMVFNPETQKEERKISLDPRVRYDLGISDQVKKSGDFEQSGDVRGFFSDLMDEVKDSVSMSRKAITESAEKAFMTDDNGNKVLNLLNQYLPEYDFKRDSKNAVDFYRMPNVDNMLNIDKDFWKDPFHPFQMKPFDESKSLNWLNDSIEQNRDILEDQDHTLLVFVTNDEESPIYTKTTLYEDESYNKILDFISQSSTFTKTNDFIKIKNDQNTPIFTKSIIYKDDNYKKKTKKLHGGGTFKGEVDSDTLEVNTTLRRGEYVINENEAAAISGSLSKLVSLTADIKKIQTETELNTDSMSKAIREFHNYTSKKVLKHHKSNVQNITQRINKSKHSKAQSQTSQKKEISDDSSEDGSAVSQSNIPLEIKAIQQDSIQSKSNPSQKTGVSSTNVSDELDKERQERLNESARQVQEQQSSIMTDIYEKISEWFGYTEKKDKENKKKDGDSLLSKLFGALKGIFSFIPGLVKFGGLLITGLPKLIGFFTGIVPKIISMGATILKFGAKMAKWTMYVGAISKIWSTANEYLSTTKRTGEQTVGDWIDTDNNSTKLHGAMAINQGLHWGSNLALARLGRNGPSSIIDAFKTNYNAAKEAQAVGTAANTGGKITQAISTVGEKAGSLVSGVSQGAGNAVRGAINGVADKAGSLISGARATTSAARTGAMATFKTAGSTVLRGIFKKLPIVGSIIAFNEAIERFKNGDIIGALLQIGSSISTLIPGPGTMVAVALDGLTLLVDWLRGRGKDKNDDSGESPQKDIKEGDSKGITYYIKKTIDITKLIFGGFWSIGTFEFRDGFEKFAKAFDEMGIPVLPSIFRFFKFEWLTDLFGSAKSETETATSSIQQDVQKMQQTGDEVKEKASSIISFITTPISYLINAFSEGFDNLISGAKEAFENAKNVLSKKWDSIKDSIGGAVNSVKSFFGFGDDEPEPPKIIDVSHNVVKTQQELPPAPEPSLKYAVKFSEVSPEVQAAFKNPETSRETVRQLRHTNPNSLIQRKNNYEQISDDDLPVKHTPILTTPSSTNIKPQLSSTPIEAYDTSELTASFGTPRMFDELNQKDTTNAVSKRGSLTGVTDVKSEYEAYVDSIISKNPGDDNVKARIRNHYMRLTPGMREALLTKEYSRLSKDSRKYHSGGIIAGMSNSNDILSDEFDSDIKNTISDAENIPKLHSGGEVPELDTEHESEKRIDKRLDKQIGEIKKPKTSEPVDVPIIARAGEYMLTENESKSIFGALSQIHSQDFSKLLESTSNIYEIISQVKDDITVDQTEYLKSLDNNLYDLLEIQQIRNKQFYTQFNDLIFKDLKDFHGIYEFLYRLIHDPLKPANYMSSQELGQKISNQISGSSNTESQNVSGDSNSGGFFSNIGNALSNFGNSVKSMFSGGGSGSDTGLSVSGGFNQNSGSEQSGSISSSSGSGSGSSSGSGGGNLDLSDIKASTVSDGGAGDLGDYVKKFESGNKGPATVAWDRTGGTSYGTYQYAAKPKSIHEFIAWAGKNGGDFGKKLQEAMSNAGPLETGSKSGQAVDVWKQFAAVDGGKPLHTLEHTFTYNKFYKKANDKLTSEARELVDKDRGLQEALWSTAVQHGPGGGKNGASGIFNKTYKSGITPEGWLKAIYAKRGTQFGSSTAQVRAAVLNRFKQELPITLGLSQKGGAIQSTQSSEQSSSTGQDTNPQASPATGDTSSTNTSQSSSQSSASPESSAPSTTTSSAPSTSDSSQSQNTTSGSESSSTGPASGGSAAEIATSGQAEATSQATQSTSDSPNSPGGAQATSEAASNLPGGAQAASETSSNTPAEVKDGASNPSQGSAIPKTSEEAVELLKSLGVKAFNTTGGGGYKGVVKVKPEVLGPFAAAVRDFKQSKNKVISITSAWRSTEDQRRLQGTKGAAKVGNSPHQRGVALDIGNAYGGGVKDKGYGTGTIADEFEPFAQKYGIWRPHNPKNPGSRPLKHEEQHFQIRKGGLPPLNSPESKGLGENENSSGNTSAPSTAGLPSSPPTDAALSPTSNPSVTSSATNGNNTVSENTASPSAVSTSTNSQQAASSAAISTSDTQPSINTISSDSQSTSSNSTLTTSNTINDSGIISQLTELGNAAQQAANYLKSLCKSEGELKTDSENKSMIESNKPSSPQSDISTQNSTANIGSNSNIEQLNRRAVTAGSEMLQSKTNIEEAKSAAESNLADTISTFKKAASFDAEPKTEQIQQVRTPQPTLSNPEVQNGGQTNAMKTGAQTATNQSFGSRPMDGITAYLIDVIFQNTVINFQQAANNFAIGNNPMSIAHV